MRLLIKKFQVNKQIISVVAFMLVISVVPGLLPVIYAGDSTRISILSTVQLDDENILLGSIADIEGQDLLLVQKLNRIVISGAPLPGESRVIKKNIIKLRLKQNEIDLSQTALQMPEEVVVKRNFIEVGPEKIKMLVSDYILKNTLKDNVDTEIREIEVSDSLRLPVGRITFKVMPPRDRDLMGKIPFAVHFDVNGKFYKRVWATATVEMLAEVVVTRKPLGRHKPITEDDIEVLKMDLAKLPSDVITDPEVVLGKRTRRAVGAKSALRANLVEFPPLVKRGDVVIIIAESNGLKITALGQVKRKGRLGESIPVINYDSKKILYARVLDSSTVKVEF